MSNPHYNQLLMDAADRVRDLPWFGPGNWTVRVGDGASWVGFQLSKANWFNEDGHGIHFETWLSDDVVQSGVLRFQAHVMHANMTFPGTETKAPALSRPVVTRHKELIASWGYRLPSAPGMGLLHTNIEFKAEDLATTLERECSRFALLGDTIDEVLACVLAGKRPPAAPRAPKVAIVPREMVWGENLLPGFGGAGAGGSVWSCHAEPGATVTIQPEADGSLRIEIGGKAKRNHDAQVICSGLPIKAGETYHASYDVKAAVPRWMTGNIRQSQPPGLSAGTFVGKTMATEWQTVSWEFLGERDEGEPCILFSVGKVPNTVWLRSVEVRPALNDSPATSS